MLNIDAVGDYSVIAREVLSDEVTCCGGDSDFAMEFFITPFDERSY